MANQIKQYFLAPSWDYPPDGPIALGNIIISPSRPVPAVVTAASAVEPKGKISSTKHEVQWQKGRTHAYQFGVWTKFIEILGVNVGINLSSDSDDLFRFEKMHTAEFFSDQDYIKSLLQTSPLADHILKKQRKPLFIVVGVKTVSGASVRRTHSRTVGGSLDVGIDAAIIGSPVPASIGPAVMTSIGTSEDVSFEGSDDFVFAFRVQKLRVKRREEGVRQEDYAKGALFGYGAAGKNAPELMEISELDAFDVLDGFVSQDVDEEGGKATVHTCTCPKMISQHQMKQSPRLE